jgi:hypothetical protein
MALVPDEEMFNFIGEDDAGDSNPQILIVRDAVESWVKKYCNRDFVVTSYKERYDGDGTNQLVLRQYPVTQITRLSLWPTDVIRICNTGTTTNATVSCFATKVTLTKDGVDTDLLFSAYTTFGSLVTAVNALSANGWSAAVVSPSFNNFLTTELIERMGLYCLESNWVYLQMPYQRGEIDFDIDSDRGIVHLFRASMARDYDGTSRRDFTGFPYGTRNIFIDYKAGYTTVPDDLKMAIKIIVKYMLQKKEEESWGAQSQSVGEVSFSSEGKELPWEAKMILDLDYKKRNFR